MNNLFSLCLIISFAYLNLWGQTPAKLSTELNVRDGDTFLFFGNSITHQRLYTQYIENYYYTRYPYKKINFINAGVSGDRAYDALERFDKDVSVFKPDFVSVLFGMNDAEYTPFSPDIFNEYKKNMFTLIDSLEKLDTEIILITPTMYDLKSSLKGKSEIGQKNVTDLHYNSTLAYFGAWCAYLAEKRELRFVNMFEPLNRITLEQRRTQPDFTLIDDGIHPEADGHAIMALTFLEDIDADPVVSKIYINVKNGKWDISADNGSIIEKNENEIEFIFKANCLPWVLPSEASIGFELVSAAEKMNKELIYVYGLDEGNYDLIIDDIKVGTYKNSDFCMGVNLGGNKITPQFQKALKVAEINKERNEAAVDKPEDYLQKHIEQLEKEYGKEKFINISLDGLFGIYYGSPHFMRPTGSGLLNNLVYNWSENDDSPGNDWSAVWYGELTSPITGEVTFSGKTDLDLILEIEGKKIIDIEQAGIHREFGSVYLKKGNKYNIVVRHSHNGGEDYIDIKWSWNNHEFSSISEKNLKYSHESLIAIRNDFWRTEINKMNKEYEKYGNKFKKLFEKINSINKPLSHKYRIKISELNIKENN